MLEYFSISVLYSLAKDGIAALRRRKRHLSPSDIVQLRQKWKPTFEARIWETYKNTLRNDVIIRDMKRIDTYPDFDKKKGISPWFRVNLLGTYYRGILVGMEAEMLTKHDQEGTIWRLTNYPAGEEGDIKVILIGSIPYENIDNVDWDGDEYYRFPQVYCFFTHKNEPYERVAYYTERINPGGLPFYTEVAPYEQVRPSAKNWDCGKGHADFPVSRGYVRFSRKQAGATASLLLLRPARSKFYNGNMGSPKRWPTDRKTPKNISRAAPGGSDVVRM